MAAAYPGIDGTLHYPTFARRCAALAQAIEEIAKKRAAGLDLVPDEKIWSGPGRVRMRGKGPEEGFAAPRQTCGG